MSIATFKIQVIKYALVGLANTGITASVIFACMHFRIDVYSANAAGYLCGIIFSFLANTLFTFNSNVSTRRFAKFILSCLICWCVNAIAIKSFLVIYPDKLYVAQLVGMLVYTLTGFLINKLWVMK